MPALTTAPIPVATRLAGQQMTSSTNILAARALEGRGAVTPASCLGAEGHTTVALATALVSIVTCCAGGHGWGGHSQQAQQSHADENGSSSMLHGGSLDNDGGHT